MKLLLIVATALLFAGCQSPAVVYPSEASAILNGYTRGEAFRLGSLYDHPGAGDKVDGFAALESTQVSGDIAQRVAAIALDPNNFQDQTRREEFLPTIAWRLYRLLPAGQGQDAVDVLVSFDCDEVLIVSRDSRLHEFFRRLVTSDAARMKLLELARDTFPADSDLSKIPDARDAAGEN